MRQPLTNPIQIKLVGVGGAGFNILNRLATARLGAVTTLAIATDLSALASSKADEQLQIGPLLTRGLGGSGNREIGRRAAEESRAALRSALDGVDVVVLVAGMGGGTGTGASTVVASIVREAGAIVVAIVSRPFTYEGRRRIDTATPGIIALRPQVDVLIVLPNDALLQTMGQSTSLQEAFERVDDVIRDIVVRLSGLTAPVSLAEIAALVDETAAASSIAFERPTP
jgi:cell division protein FtsZ